MRTIFLGAGSMSLRTAKTMVERNHEVVIIERSQEVVARVQEELDCGCLLGDGTRPRVLREADPAHADVLFCLTGNDQTNLIASLVGRSLGFQRVITRINDEEFEHVCLELGLQDLVLPTRTIGRYLAHMAEGHEVLDLSAAIRGEARIFMFVAGDAENDVALEALALPPGSRVALLYRDGEFQPADPAFELRRGDELVLVAPRRDLEKLRERWGGPPQS
jgi:trk system potassium uptake protein TrkA